MRFRLGIPVLMVLAAGLCLAQAPAETEGATATPALQAPATAAEAKPPAPTADPKLQAPPTKLPSGAAAKPPKSAPPVGADGKPYVIGSTDVLYIRVWNNQNLTGMVDVRPDGMISLALVGEMKADGLTVEELTQQLKTKLGEFLINPEVDVQVPKINSKKFMVVGGVAKPGSYPLIGKITIFEALTNAGILETAKQNKVYLLRGKEKHPFNYKDAMKGLNKDPDMPIEDGDRIIVPQ